MGRGHGPGDPGSPPHLPLLRPLLPSETQADAVQVCVASCALCSSTGSRRSTLTLTRCPAQWGWGRPQATKFPAPASVGSEAGAMWVLTASLLPIAAWLRGERAADPAALSLARRDDWLLRPHAFYQVHRSRHRDPPPATRPLAPQHQGPGDPAAAGEQHARHVSWGLGRSLEGGGVLLTPPLCLTLEETLQTFTTADLFPSRVFRLPLVHSCVCLCVCNTGAYFFFFFFKPFALYWGRPTML